MDRIENGVLQGSLLGDTVGTVSLENGIVGEALSLDGNQYVHFGNFSTRCFQNPDMCNSGITFAMWVKFKAPDSAVFDTGAFDNKASGYAVVLNPNEELKIAVKWANGYEYHTIPDASWVLNRWIHMSFSWKRNERIALYINGCGAYTGQVFRISRIDPLSTHGVFVIGAAIHDSLKIVRLANMGLDEFYVWHEVLLSSEIWRLYAAGGKR